MIINFLNANNRVHKLLTFRGVKVMLSKSEGDLIHHQLCERRLLKLLLINVQVAQEAKNFWNGKFFSNDELVHRKAARRVV